ncbi:DUF1127 domain-containing protein [Fluviibacterium sp. DFM31]|uniref:DUF1127 domain-containing protein n=1 Tax=Meridianimarinicoccus marinus TaxID=3231483 RepID=A0ABV3L6U7_9RHOB
MAFAADIRTHDTSIVERIEHAIAAFKQYRARRAVYRQTVNELSILSDRDLNDLGISRWDIPLVARDAANLI